MNKIYKHIILLIIFTVLGIAINTNVYATGIGMSINKSSAYVGDTFSVTISGINGKVNISGNSNISLSTSGTKWVEGSMTITGTAKSVGTGVITITPIDVSTTGADPQEVTTSSSKSIIIKEKEKPQPTKPTSPSNNISTTKKNTTKQTTKTDTKKENKKEDNFYISNISLKGFKENGEQLEVALSPAFDKNIYEYTCNITSDIQKIDLQKDAGEYTNSVIVTGLDELKEGENIITLQLSAENYQAKTYTIKVIKDKKEEIQEVVTEVQQENENIDNNNEKAGTQMISMPLWVFILMQVLIIVVEIIIIYFVPWKKIIKRKLSK